MKYKVGDKVLVREDLIEFEQYKYISFVPSMNPFKGKIVTIYNVTDRYYIIEEDSKRYHWTDDMFSEKVSQDFSFEEPVSQNRPPEEKSSYDIITIKTTKVKLLLL